MNKENQSIIKSFRDTLNGQPWYGRSINEIIEEVDETKVEIKPNGSEHSMLELLWHMITWAEFCLKQLENASADEIKEVETRDWRGIDLKIHTWKKGMNELKNIHEKIIAILKTKDDSFLSEIVKERKFNFRFILNGLIQHNIYHLGQIAYVKKLLG